MSNIFKFYINNNNTFNEVYLFIKNKYINTNSHTSSTTIPSSTILTSSIPSITELNTNYNNYNSFIHSEIYEKHFATDFNHYDLTYLKTSF